MSCVSLLLTCLFFFVFFSLSRSLCLFLSSLLSLESARPWIVRVSLRSRDGRDTRVSRAPLKKSIKRRIITEEGVSTHGIYDVLVRGWYCRFTAAAAAATRSSVGYLSLGLDLCTELAYERTNLRCCTSAPHSSPPRSDDPNIPLWNIKATQLLTIDKIHDSGVSRNIDFISC